MAENKQKPSSTALGGQAGDSCCGKIGAVPGEHTAVATVENTLAHTHRGSSTAAPGERRVALQEKKAAADDDGKGRHSSAELAFAHADPLSSSKGRHSSAELALAHADPLSSMALGGAMRPVSLGEKQASASREDGGALVLSSTHQGSSTVALGERGRLPIREMKKAVHDDGKGRHSSAELARARAVPDCSKALGGKPMRQTSHGSSTDMAAFDFDGEATRDIDLVDKSVRQARHHRSGAQMVPLAQGGEAVRGVSLGSSIGDDRQRRDKGKVIMIAQPAAASSGSGEISRRLNLSKKAVRAQCRDALEMAQNGVLADAAKLAVQLAREYPGFSFTNTLAAGLCQALASDTMELVLYGGRKSDKEVTKGLDAAVDFYSTSREFYDAAAKLAPGCIQTGVGRFQVLVACQNLGAVYIGAAGIFGAANFAPAQKELSRAISIAETADDPGLHNVCYDLRPQEGTYRSGMRSTTRRRVLLARREAEKEQTKFQRMICSDYIPRRLELIWPQIETEEAAPGRFLGVARELFHIYPYCPRAHVFLARMELKLATDIEEEVHRSQVMSQLQLILHDSAGKFPKSLVIALVCAEIAFMLDQFEAAVKLCSCGLDIRNGTDPWEEDVPVHSTQGYYLEERIIYIKNTLQELSDASSSKCAAAEIPCDNPEQATVTRQQSAKSNRIVKYAYRYGHNKKKPRDPSQAPLYFDIQVPIRVPVTVPVYLVCGEFVPQEVVDVFKKYCIARLNSLSNTTPCHLCCFSTGCCSPVPKDRFRVHHYAMHNTGQKGEAIICKEKDCYARFWSKTEFRQHMHFVHRLPQKWWEEEKKKKPMPD